MGEQDKLCAVPPGMHPAAAELLLAAADALRLVAK